MAVQILLNQAAKPAGVPGQAREDLDLGVPVQIQVVGGPFAKVFWAIRDRPIDYVTPKICSAIVTTPTAPSTTITGNDVEGTILLAVAVDAGFGLGARPEDNATITLYAGTPLGAYGSLPVRNPAFGEKKEHNVPVPGVYPQNPRGWALATDYWRGVLSAVAASVAWLDFTTTTALAAAPIPLLTWGQIAHVESLDAHYLWVPAAGYAGPASGLQIVAGAGGSWWFRLPERSPRYALQTVWFVDGAGGSDENDGLTSLTALASLAELFTRIAPYGVAEPIGAVTVTIAQVGGPYVMQSFVLDQSRGSLHFVGTPTVVSSSTWAAYTASVPATNTRSLGVSTNGAETFFEEEILHVPDSSANAYVVVAKAPAVSQARITIPFDIVALTPLAQPAPGDHYSRLLLPQITLAGSIEAIGKGVPTRSSFSLLNIVGSAPNTNTLNHTKIDGMTLLGCREFNLVLGSCTSVACATVVAFASGGVPLIGMPASNFVYSAIFSLSVSNRTDISKCFLSSASSRAITVLESGYLFLGGDNAVDAAAGAAIQLFEPGAVVDASQTDCLYGASSYVFTFSAGDVTVYGDPFSGPVLAGTVQDFHYTFTGTNDAWWPAYTDGAVVPASNPVPTYAVLNAAPYAGKARHVTNDARFLIR